MMPMTAPFLLSKGPPLLPGLIAASVCTSVAPPTSRRPLTMPRLTVFWRNPSGVPIAITSSPMRTLAAVPSGRIGLIGQDAEDLQHGDIERRRRRLHARRRGGAVRSPDGDRRLGADDVNVGDEGIRRHKKAAAAGRRGLDGDDRGHHARDQILECSRRIRHRRRGFGVAGWRRDSPDGAAGGWAIRR